MTTAMRVGVLLPNDPVSASVVDVARSAERLGYALVAAGEHVFFPSPTASAWISLAAAAGATTRIELLSSVIVAPMYAPAVIAKMAQTLDAVSGGRFHLGLGTGGDHAPEFQSLGIAVQERGRLTNEACDVVLPLLQGRAVEGQRLLPGVVRPVPVWIGGRKGPALDRVVRYADVWLPYLISASGYARGWAELSSKAEKAGRDPASIGRALFAWVCVDADSSAARSRAIETVNATYGKDLSRVADRCFVTGTPTEVLSTLNRFREAGVDTVVAAFACPPPAQLHMTELFGEIVLPTLAD